MSRDELHHRYPQGLKNPMERKISECSNQILKNKHNDRKVGLGTCSVEDHAHGKLLQSDIVDDLVQSTLHEGGVDRDERLQTLCYTTSMSTGTYCGSTIAILTNNHASGEGHGVLLSDADVERALGKAAPHLHTQRDSHIIVVT